MSWVTRYGTRAIVVMLALALSHGAKAQVYIDLGSLKSSGPTTFSVGTWSLVFASQTNSATARGCDYSSSWGGDCDNVTVEAQIHRGVLELDFFRSTTGNPTVQSGSLLTGSSGSTNRDLFLNFAVDTPTANTNQKIKNVSLAISGSNASQSSLFGTGYLCNTATSCLSSGSFASFETGTGAATPASYALTSSQQTSSLNVSKNLFSTGSSLNISKMTQYYVSTPEPMSFSILGVGVVALGAARLYGRRRMSPAT